LSYRAVARENRCSSRNRPRPRFQRVDDGGQRRCQTLGRSELGARQMHCLRGITSVRSTREKHRRAPQLPLVTYRSTPRRTRSAPRRSPIVRALHAPNAAGGVSSSRALAEKSLARTAFMGGQTLGRAWRAPTARPQLIVSRGTLRRETLIGPGRQDASPTRKAIGASSREDVAISWPSTGAEKPQSAVDLAPPALRWNVSAGHHELALMIRSTEYIGSEPAVEKGDSRRAYARRPELWLAVTDEQSRCWGQATRG